MVEGFALDTHNVEKDNLQEYLNSQKADVEKVIDEILFYVDIDKGSLTVEEYLKSQYNDFYCEFMADHIEGFGGEETHECLYCDKTFVSRTDVSPHISNCR